MINDPLTSIPAWIVDLSIAASRLTEEQLRVLAGSYGREATPFVPSAAQLQRRLSLSTTDATELARNLRRVLAVPHVTGRDVGIVLVTLAHARSAGSLADEQVDVVCTAPSRFGVPLRTTFATAVEMVQTARQTIFVIGYIFTGGARAFIEQLAAASRDRAVQVTLIGNRMRDQLSIIRSMWPADCPPPGIFSREASPTDDMAALHAKLLICDNIVALITSANFSYHGLHENIEVGVKIRSPSVARLVEFIQAMIRLGEVTAVE
jgi:phosphatidylserine/phosphatidylglycerophosphate/cardiolipin synthase-like enzyme